jgi:hypothetical protein
MYGMDVDFAVIMYMVFMVIVVALMALETFLD